MKYKIKYDDIKKVRSSIVDDVGFVFHWENKIYRAISKKYESFYLKLFEEGIDELFPVGLVETKISDIYLEDFPLVLEHRKLDCITYPVEWSSEMLRNAAITLCDINIELLKKGLTIKDAHGWNILFDKDKPFFIDWGSIVPVDSQQRWPYVEFSERFIYPLYLMSCGQGNYARMFMLEALKRQGKINFFRLMLGKLSIFKMLKFWFKDYYCKRKSSKFSIEFFCVMKAHILSIDIKEQTTDWTEYRGPNFKYSLEYSEDWPIRIKNIYKTIKSLQPRNVLDLGCNQGWFSLLAESLGCKVVSADIDGNNINKVYELIKKDKKQINTLVLDLCEPTPPHGMMFAHRPVHERLRTEFVLVLAVTHHLVFKRGCSFELIADELNKYSSKWLLVEFVPSDDEHVARWMTEDYSWYTFDAFSKALSKYFKKIEVMESSPSPRVMLLCEK